MTEPRYPYRLSATRFQQDHRNDPLLVVFFIELDSSKKSGVQ